MGCGRQHQMEVEVRNPVNGRYNKMGEFTLTGEEKNVLLKLARMKLESAVAGSKINSSQFRPTPSLKERKGCFVSLYKNGELRGCVGRLRTIKRLYESVLDMTAYAASRDSRFPRVTKEELDDIKIEVTVLLSPPKRICSASAEDLKNKLQPGIDGVVLKRLFRRSTYLPQVWETTPDKEEFLASLCEKGGMKPDCWKKTSTKVYVYQVIHFSE